MARLRHLACITALLLIAATGPAQGPAALPGPPAASRPLAEGLALLASADPGFQAEGRAILQANAAGAGDPAAREAVVAALLDFAEGPPAAAAGSVEDFQPGLEAWLTAWLGAAFAAQQALAEDSAGAAARREAVAWAGYLAAPTAAARFEALLAHELVWREALNALMLLPEGAGHARVIARLPTEASADRQIEYVRALGQFQVRDARPALTQIAQNNENRALAWAALDALALVGVPPVTVVKRPADVTPEEAARYAAAGLRAAQELLDHGNPKEAGNLFRVYSDASGLWSQIRAAMIGLVAVGSPDATRTALGYLGTPRLRADAIRVLCETRAPGADEMIDKAFKIGDPAMQSAILEVYLKRGGDEGKKKVEAALTAEAADVRVAAARLLGASPNPADLLDSAVAGAPWARDAARDAFLDDANARLLSGDHVGAAAQFRIVLERRLGPGAVRAALEGLGQCGEYADNELIAEFMGLPDTGPAAYAAKARLALKLPDREEAIRELEMIAEVSPYEEGVFAAAEGLTKLGLPSVSHAQRRGYLTTWRAIGPFPNELNKAYGLSFITEEHADALEIATWLGKNYKWDNAPAPGFPPIVDVRTIYPDAATSAVYLAARFALSRPMAAELQLSIGGAFELWVNGKRLAGDATPHSWRQDEIRVETALSAGVNKVLVKLIQSPEDWRCSVRVADRRGKPVDLEAQRPAKDGSEGVGVTAGRAADAVQKSAP
jgi:hypothetical protein